MSPPASKQTVKKISSKINLLSQRYANSTLNTQEVVILAEKQGYFGNYGGRFVPETLVPALDELTAAYQALQTDTEFWREFESYGHYYIGRPTPLYFAERLTAHCGGAKILLKREDLAHTGAHKINTMPSAGASAKKTGQKTYYRRDRRRSARRRHCRCRRAYGNWKCVILHGLGRHRTSETERLPDEINGRLSQTGFFRQPHAERCYQRSPSAIGQQYRQHPLPHGFGGRATPPIPQWCGISSPSSGKKHREQILKGYQRLPRYIVCPVSAAAATPWACSTRSSTIRSQIGRRRKPPVMEWKPANMPPPCRRGRSACCTGAKSYVLQDKNGQILETHSISAGLDYPRCRPGTQLPQRQRPGGLCQHHR